VGVAEAVGVDEGRAVLEDEAPGLGSPLQPESSTDAASGTASRAAEVFFTDLSNGQR
jgi:hypothetical protein